MRFTSQTRKTVNDRRTSCRIVKHFRADDTTSICLTRPCSPPQNSAVEKPKNGKLENEKCDPVRPTLAAVSASQFGRPLRFPLVAENKIARTAEPK
jgi:hypothetical protein